MSLKRIGQSALETPGPIRTCPLAILLCMTRLLSGCDDNTDGPLIPEPDVLESSGGVLQVTLTAAPAQITVAGQTFTSNVFNGEYIPPVLQLERGDVLELKLINRIGPADIEIDAAQDTNLHYHGMSIPPVAPADDIYLHILPTAEFDYRWQVPFDHPQGTHWYHPHPHGFVEPQILSGMSGMLIIEGLLEDHYPAFAELVQRNLLLKDIVLPGAADGDPATKTINGVLGGVLLIRPGELQVWNLGNLGANAYFDFVVEGAQLWELSRDGNVLAAPKQLESVFLPPGSRSTIVVVAPPNAGSYAIRSRMVDTGPQGDPNPDVQLGTLVVRGRPMMDPEFQARLLEPAINRGITFPTLEEVAAMPITRQRTITFSETEDGNTFFIDGRTFDEARDDIVVNLGDVEEWTVRNISGERHVFHIHQLDFLVLSINNQDIDEIGLRDTIDVPYQQNGVPGEVKLIIPFVNPAMLGRFVYHCHIVEHEDGGMMANLVVVSPLLAAVEPAKTRFVQPDTGSFFARLKNWYRSSRSAVQFPMEFPMCTTPGRTASVRDAVATKD